jgi:predicted MPP superfamily phosphohydrolase
MLAFLAALPSADVTIVTGDLLGEPEAVETVVRALRPARGRLASYFVLGSNDYFVPRPLNYFRYFRKRRTPRFTPPGRAAELVSALESEGWQHLRNVRREIDLDGASVELLGLDDPHIAWHDLRVAPRRSPDRFGLAIVHSPDPAPELAALGYDLIVAGHTHGGQVRMPLVGALVTNCSLPPRLAAGLIRFGSSYLHTSAGLGTSKYAPFRFLCRPEGGGAPPHAGPGRVGVVSCLRGSSRTPARSPRPSLPSRTVRARASGRRGGRSRRGAGGPRPPPRRSRRPSR